MATARRPPILLRHIHRLATAQSLVHLPDRELLQRFADLRDEEAFGTLVRRHGSMVLHVGQRVLHNSHDAEDLLQATFLVLARKAKSLRWQESVGNWLYQVAYRLALKSRTASARRATLTRRAREGGLAGASGLCLDRGPQAGEPGEDLSWREVEALLDEELHRLPVTYRVPLVFCYLEGATRDEAAQQLGWSLSTLKRRLERGRELLRLRLVRRGLTLSAALFAPMLTESTAQAALATDLVQATVRSALGFAAGRPVTGLVSAQVAALVEGGLKTMFLTKFKVATALVVAIAVVAAGAWMRQALTARPAEPVAYALPAPRGSDSAGTLAGPKPPPAAASTEAVPYSGRVIGPDGEPVAGAKVYYHFITREDEPIPSRARTDASGQFSFTLSPKDVPLSADATQSDPLKTGHIVAKAEGFTFAWRGVAKGTAHLELRLARDDTPILGRILDLQGKPLAGLKVSVLSMAAPDKGDLTPFVQALKPRQSVHEAIRKHLPNLFGNPLIYQPYYLPILPSARTDANGRFQLPGFAPEQLIELRIEGPAIETQNLFVLNRPKPASAEALLARPRYHVQDSEYSGPTEQAIVRWNDFEHAAAPGQVVAGTVRDEATKARIPGAMVESYSLAGTNLAQNPIYHTIADEQGQYRFTGLPRGKGNRIRIRPPRELPYLPVVKEVPPKGVFAEADVDVDLPPGVFVNVTATDKNTGKPVPGYVSYFILPETPDPANPFQRPFADSYNDFMPIPNDGAFRFVALRRKAIVAFRADWEKYPIAKEAPTIRLPAGLSSSNFQAFATIHPKSDDQAVQVDFVLDTGGVVKGRVIGPDGQPVSGVLPAGLRHDWFYGPESQLKTAEFTAIGLELDHPRLLCFVHWEKKLAGSAVVRGNEKAPLTVKLAPWATVSGRLLDSEGKPIKDATLWFTEVPRGQPGQPRPLDTGVHVVDRSAYKPNPDPHTDEQGRFEISGLVPGLKYNLALIDARGAVEPEQVKWLGLAFSNLVLKPGDSKDLGNVKLQPFPKK